MKHKQDDQKPNSLLDRVYEEWREENKQVMSICYDLERWTMITFAIVAISLTIGVVTLAYGQESPESYAQLQGIKDTLRDFKMTIDYCYEHANSANPVQDLVDKGFVPNFNGWDCKKVKETYQLIWNNFAELVAQGKIKDTNGNVLSLQTIEKILNEP